MLDEIPALDPVEMVRDFRANYVNFSLLRGEDARILEGVEIVRPEHQPIEALPLPEDLLAIIKDHGERSLQLTLLKYMRIENGKPVFIVEDERDLPDERSLVSFSHTVTVTRIDAVEIVTHLVIGDERRA